MDWYSVFQQNTAEYDGHIFAANQHTGNFCRPVCSEPLPIPSEVRFLESMPACINAGFEPCPRCGPQHAPGAPILRQMESTAGRAALAQQLPYQPLALLNKPAQNNSGRLKTWCFALDMRPPFDWSFFLNYLGARTIPGLEEIDTQTYRRVLRCGDDIGWLKLEPAGERSLKVSVGAMSETWRAVLAPRLRFAFDLDHCPQLLKERVSGDPLIAEIFHARPGIRMPRGLDPFEQAIRAVLGQQVSVNAAAKLAGKLCRHFGDAVTFAGLETLTHSFPTPAALATADISVIGMPQQRARTINHLARAVLEDEAFFAIGQSLDEVIERLLALKGIGPWSAHYIAMRVFAEIDAFPVGDAALLRALTPPGQPRPDKHSIAQQSRAWQGWRAYAAQLLWAKTS